MTVRGSYESHASGSAAECIVTADLLLRKLEVTKPLVDWGDDLHARFVVGWRSIQVKVRDRSRKSWRVSSSTRNRMRSEILALVDPDTWEVRYRSINGETLPAELQ